MKAFLYKRPILKLERKNEKLPLCEVAAEVTQKVKTIWRKAGIPTVLHTRVAQLFVTYHDKKYLSLLKSVKLRGRQENFQSKMSNLVDIARVTLFDISACKCINLESCSCDKSRKVPIKEQNFLKDQRNDRSLFIEKLDQEETAWLTKNIKPKEIEKQRAILAAQKTSYDDNESLGDEVEEEMEHLAKDDLSYEVNRNLEAEARQSITNNSSSSSQMRKGPKLFTQTCNRFQIPDGAASALSSALFT